MNGVCRFVCTQRLLLPSALSCHRYFFEFKLFWALGYKLGIRKFNDQYEPNAALEAHFVQRGAKISRRAMEKVCVCVCAMTWKFGAITCIPRWCE